MHTNVAAHAPEISREILYKNKECGGVLVVEDEVFVREAAAEMLEAHGYEVFKAGNFAEALRVFRNNSSRVNLLLTDVIIPGQNGCELGKILRQLSQQLKILYISGYSQKAIAQKIALDSHSRFMAKPFSSEQLLAAVKAVFTVAERR
jgi:two-component system, cell cycle sensor histidine kinase and response regulator CckA